MWNQIIPFIKYSLFVFNLLLIIADIFMSLDTSHLLNILLRSKKFPTLWIPPLQSKSQNSLAHLTLLIEQAQPIKHIHIWLQLTSEQSEEASVSWDSTQTMGSMTSGGINNAFTEAVSQCDLGIVSDASHPSLTFWLSQDSKSSLIL